MQMHFNSSIEDIVYSEQLHLRKHNQALSEIVIELLTSSPIGISSGFSVDSTVGNE